MPEQVPAVEVFRLIAQWRLPRRCFARVALHSSQLRAASTKSLRRYRLLAIPVSGSQRLPASCNEPPHYKGNSNRKGPRKVVERQVVLRWPTIGGSTLDGFHRGEPMAAVIAPADRADLARKPIAGLVSIMSARSGSACVDISITGTGAPSSLS